MASVRFRFCIRKITFNGEPKGSAGEGSTQQTDHGDGTPSGGKIFWGDLIKLNPSLQHYPYSDQPELVLDQKIRSEFPTRMSEHLRNMMREAGAEYYTGSVGCSFHSISYGSLEIVLDIFGHDVIAKAFKGAFELFMAALEWYAIEAFEFVLPHSKTSIVLETTADPALTIAFMNAKSSPTDSILKRLLRTNAVILFPALGALFLILIGGFLILFFAQNLLMHEKEVAMKLLMAGIEENREATKDASKRAQEAESAVREVLKELSAQGQRRR